MKFKLIFSVLFLNLTMSLFAFKTDNGELYFNNKQYVKARSIYEALLKQKPNDGVYNYRYARCCYELKDYESAIVHFEMSGNKFPLRDLFLGELYFNTYRFDQSVMAYQTYISTLKPDDKSVPEFQLKIKRAENAARLLAKTEDIAIVDSVIVNKADFLRYYKFSKELGSISQESMKLSAKHIVDKIKYTTQRQDRVYYSDSIHGQLDIFTSYRLLDAWSEPTPISDLINTSANENYPFLLLDGVTVYFASDGENSIGGYDLFVTRFNPSSNTYLTPENIGLPYNSPANDYMMVIDEQRKLGWFATDRNQSNGKVIIYTFVPNDSKIIVHSDDKDYLRRVAQLKIYRKQTGSQTDSVTSIQPKDGIVRKQFEFVINDSIVYTNLSQFKSKDAVKLWTDLHNLTLDYQSKMKELSELRVKYNLAENETQRTTLSPAIMKLEKNCAEMDVQITVKTKQVRNVENKFLQSIK